MPCDNILTAICLWLLLKQVLEQQATYNSQRNGEQVLSLLVHIIKSKIMRYEYSVRFISILSVFISHG